MSEVTKEELMALTEAYSKTATVLEKIASRLEDVILKQDKIIDKFSNGLSQDIRKISDTVNTLQSNSTYFCDTLKDSLEEVFKPHFEDAKDLKTVAKDIKDDVKFSKLFIGAVALVIVISTVILRGIDTRVTETNKIKQYEQYIQQLEQKEALLQRKTI